MLSVKLSVIRNIPTAPMLPRAESRGANEQTAIKTPRAISTPPTTAESAETLRKS